MFGLKINGTIQQYINTNISPQLIKIFKITTDSLKLKLIISKTNRDLVTSIVAVGKKPVLLLIGPIEEEVGLEPFWVADEIAGDEPHEAVAGLGPLRHDADLAADHVDLLVHVPVPRQPALAGPPRGPPADAELVEAVIGDPALGVDVVDLF